MHNAHVHVSDGVPCRVRLSVSVFLSVFRAYVRVHVWCPCPCHCPFRVVNMSMDIGLGCGFDHGVFFGRFLDANYRPLGEKIRQVGLPL